IYSEMLRIILVYLPPVLVQEICLRDRHRALATMRHHRQVGSSIRVDFDSCDLLLSGQLRYQSTSAGTWLKYAIKKSDAKSSLSLSKCRANEPSSRANVGAISPLRAT